MLLNIMGSSECFNLGERGGEGDLVFDYPCACPVACAACRQLLDQYKRSADKSSAVMPGMLLWAKRNLKVVLEYFT